jgi:hypothetical protein
MNDRFIDSQFPPYSSFFLSKLIKERVADNKQADVPILLRGDRVTIAKLTG